MSKETSTIWNEFHDNVYGFVLKRIKDKQDTNDIVQDVFVKIHLNKHTLKDESKLQAWIYQITRNSINDYFKSVAKNKDGFLDENHKIIETIEDEDISFYGKQEMFCCLGPFLDEMDKKYSVPLIMSDIKGKKLQEVADFLNISLSGAKSRVQRAREILKKDFVSCCQYSFDENGKLIGDQDCSRCNH